jgi:hypothetical protein
VVLVRGGRHGQPRVVGEQGEQAVQVTVHEGFCETAGQFAFRGRRHVPARCSERGAGPLQRSLDRDLGGAEHVRDLRRAVTEHVAQHQRGRLPRRQPLQRDDEGQLHRLPARRPRFRRLRVRLQPGDVAAAGRFRRVERRQGLGGDPSPAVPDRVEAAVGGDAVQPGARRGPSLERVEAAPGREQHLLQHVVGVGERAEQAVAVQAQLAAVRLDQVAERVRFTHSRILSRRHRSGSASRGVGTWCRPFTSRIGRKSWTH